MDPTNTTLLIDRLQAESRYKMNMDAIYSARTQEMMRRMAFPSAVMGATNTFIASPIATGIGMPINPLNPIDAAAKVLGMGTVYQNQRLQTQALMGSAGAGAVNQFDSSGVDRFANSLKAIGASRTEALQTMQALVTMSRQISTSMSDATMAVMNFSKATGLDRGAVAAVAGNAVLGSTMQLNQNTALQLFNNLQGLSRGNNAMILPMAQAVQGFREMQLQRGRAVTFDRNGVDNATNLMSMFVNTNPTVYGQRPDIAMRHASQVSSAGQGMFLGIAMDIAARAGKPTDIASVMAALQNQESWLMGPLSRELASGGMRDLAAMSGIDAQFLLNGGIRGAGFAPGSMTLETMEELAQRFTSEQDELAASQRAAGEEMGRGPASGIAGMLNAIPGGKYIAGGAAAAGLAFAARKPAARMMQLYGDRKKAKAVEKFLDAKRAGIIPNHAKFETWLKGAGDDVAEAGAKAGGKSLGKFLGKSSLKKIPLLGLGFGAIFAAERYFDGDTDGAALELASGAASMLPGVGTAASIAIDASLMSSDMAADATAVQPKSYSEIMAQSFATDRGPMRQPTGRSGNLMPFLSGMGMTPTTYFVNSAKPEELFKGFSGDYIARAELVAGGMKDRGFNMSASRVTDAAGTTKLQMQVLDAKTGRPRNDEVAVQALAAARQAADARFAPVGGATGSTPTAKDLTQALSQLTTALTTLDTTLKTQATGSTMFTTSPFSPYKK